MRKFREVLKVHIFVKVSQISTTTQTDKKIRGQGVRKTDLIQVDLSGVSNTNNSLILLMCTDHLL